VLQVVIQGVLRQLKPEMNRQLQTINYCSRKQIFAQFKWNSTDHSVALFNMPRQFSGEKLMTLQTIYYYIYFFCFMSFYPNATIVLLFADLQIYSITVTEKKKKKKKKTSLFQHIKFRCNNDCLSM
jgi:hypothetical protein